jgi:xylan 1,4-beta-xylosidase
VNAWVTRGNASIRALFVNHALPRHAIAPARVSVHLAHAPEPSAAWIERIDDDHANAKRRWQAWGAPEYLDGRTVDALHAASELVREACPWTWRDGRLTLEIELPAHAVAALTVEFAPS